MPLEKRRHQRTINNFQVDLYLAGDPEGLEHRFAGMTQEVSPFGASVALTLLAEGVILQVDDVVRVETSVNCLPGQINAAWEKEGRRFVGLRLLENGTWL